MFAFCAGLLLLAALASVWLGRALDAAPAPPPPPFGSSSSSGRHAGGDNGSEPLLDAPERRGRRVEGSDAEGEDEPGEKEGLVR